jgi:cell division protein FtsW
MLSVLPRDGFAFLAGFPLLTQLLAQACVNICVVTAMVPPKGIPHPLLSYGGSNLVMSLVTLGLICGLTSPPAEPRGASGTTEPP